MKSFPIAVVLLAAGLLAQAPAAEERTLQALIAEHQKKIADSQLSEDADAEPKALAAYIAALREFLQKQAKGEERHEARFVLIDALLAAGDGAGAKAALEAFDHEQASALSCAGAAHFARVLGMEQRRQALIAIALDKKSSFDERMELGVQLVSHLAEPAQGEALFAAALAAAADDEARAHVLWHQARATREREDLPEGSYEQALADLAKRLPKTRFGGIAADRRKAMDFAIGGDPLRFEVATLDGKRFALAEQRGKVVLVCFWAAGDAVSALACRALQDLHAKAEARGLQVLGVSLDKRVDEAKAAIQRWKTTYPQAFVEGGWSSDLALRHRIEHAPFVLLVGRDGKIAGMNFALADEDGRAELAEAVSRALEKGAEPR